MLFSNVLCIVRFKNSNLLQYFSRLNKFELLVALNETGFAEGELYWDDGDSLCE